MPRPKANPLQAKLKRQKRIQKYKANPTVKEHIRIQRKSYRQKKKEEARLQQHQDPLAQLAHVDTQQHYLEDVPEVLVAPKHTDEWERIDTGIMIEEDEEILENQGQGE